MTHPLVRSVRARLRAAADPERAVAMQAYMKSSMPCLGVDAPGQRRVRQEIFAAHPLATFGEWQALVLTLWRQAGYREERYAAIALAGDRAYRSFRSRTAIPMLEEMIVTGAWWDFVDALATNHLGDVLRHERGAGRGASMERRLLTWAAGDNLWKRRAAILAQIGFKHDTDVDLLHACIAPSLLEPVATPSRARRTRTDECRTPRSARGRDIRHDFFIRKAIGWALRQHARIAPVEVRRYVETHASRLSPLSIREAMKHL
jgi:3-methyladenine DNA glycosylase AlkD